jgi:hypothetical protein
MQSPDANAQREPFTLQGTEAPLSQHAGFHALIPLAGRMVATGQDPSPILLIMGGYVSGNALDDWFDKEWELLEQKRTILGSSRTGLAGGMSPLEFSARQWRLIMRGARRYHILESGVPRPSWQSMDEKLARFWKEGA